jgi:hypothetical protein
MDFNDYIGKLKKDSDLVVYCRVSEMNTSIEPSVNVVYTEYTISIKEHIKGSEKVYQIILYNLGGKHNDQINIVMGQPALNVDEELILFLKKIPPDVKRLAGKYLINCKNEHFGVFKIIDQDNIKYAYSKYLFAGIPIKTYPTRHSGWCARLSDLIKNIKDI